MGHLVEDPSCLEGERPSCSLVIGEKRSTTVLNVRCNRIVLGLRTVLVAHCARSVEVVGEWWWWKEGE